MQEKTEQRTAQETAKYLAEITSGLSKLAKEADLEVVAYLLDMARLEAEEIVQKTAAK